ncbi:uncharacterized protein LOC128627135 isoform X2 [Artibeus jamaicensis]|uniref:uncharacterized protein LOC128627135 isoform X2 n=1 Tax=Artibeus jamaicensis TaxID=9417 RepID=UPI00235ADFE8|nr:uncharacterized protein LOC128627135 isoform X2 [Artibeus jamaicensis]
MPNCGVQHVEQRCPQETSTARRSLWPWSQQPPPQVDQASYSDYRQGLPRELTTLQTEVLPELCPQLQGCGGRREEAWPSSSLNELPRAVVLTFSLGIRAPNKFKLHFRGPQKTETSSRTRQRQSGNRRGVVVGKVPAVLGGLGQRPAGVSILIEWSYADLIHRPSLS